MKKQIFIIVSLCVSLVSCQDWLDIDPKTSIKQDKLFKTESGFKDALAGVYMIISEPSLYAREMNITFMDVIAQQYEMDLNSSYKEALRYNYENAAIKSIIRSIWGESYNAIANINAILDNIDSRRSVLTPTAYAVIKGEALGLRAFLHFDLLRMFSPGNLAGTPANLDKAAIPYVIKYDKNMTEQYTVREVLALIHADLAAAEALLNNYDALGRGNKPDDYAWPDASSDAFYGNRRSRFNFHAVKATQARVYMWEGKYAEALAAVKGFITGTDPYLPWVNSDRSITGDIKERDYKITSEAAFQINAFQHYKSIRDYVEYYKENIDFSSRINIEFFFHSISRADQIYEATTVGRADWRYTVMYNRDLPQLTFNKYYEWGEMSDGVKNRVVLIKKPEMFYIAAECYNKLGSANKAIDMINQVRVNRGISYNDNLVYGMTTDLIDAEIEKEYKKEFVGEGVMFFYYKRLNKLIPWSTVSSDDKVFVLPMPDREVEIGGREK